MYEFTVTNNSANNLTDFLYNQLYNQISTIGGIVIKQQVASRFSISLAVEDNYKEYAKGVLTDAIADAIIYTHKYEYLQSNIYLNINNEGLKAFLQALVVFDRQTDKDIIKKHLTLERELFIDSFYKFKLYELKDRWAEIANIVNDSIPIMLKNKSVSEITRYFVDSTEDGPEVHLYIDDGKIKLERLGDYTSLEYTVDGDYENSLVCEIISLSPNKIIIHGTAGFIEKLERTLSSVFYGKIYRVT